MEEKLNLLDRLIQLGEKWISNPRSSFVFGGVFFLGLFFVIIHVPAINNYKTMLAASHKDIEFWKKKNENTENNCNAKLTEAEDRIRRTQDEALINLMKTNSFLKDLKADKFDKADLTKKVAEYQNKILN